MNATTINGLWAYLQTLSLSNQNKQWLADRLIESKTTNAKPYTVEELDRHLEEAEQEFASGNVLTMEEADNDMDNFVKSLS